jgi:hypothetical protein
MSIHIGREPYIAFALENTAGTTSTAAKTYIPFVSANMKAVAEKLEDEAVKGVRERVWGAAIGMKRGEGDVECYVDATHAPYLLYPALGSITSTGSGESGSYVHTITRKNVNPPKTFTLTHYDGVDTRQFTYGTINTLEMTVSDGLATMSANLLSKFPTTGTGTRAITSERILAFKDYQIQFGTGATGTAALADAATNTATPVRSFSLTINNNAEAHYVSGSESIAHVGINQLEITGDYVLFYENTTDRAAYETMVYGSDLVRAMIVTFTGKLLGATKTEKIVIKIPNFHLSDRTTDTSASGFITENPSFTADYDATEAKSIQIEVTNAKTGY